MKKFLALFETYSPVEQFFSGVTISMVVGSAVIWMVS